MISPAQQQLDEALTIGGHSDSCPAFEGRRCPGPPFCDGNPVDDALYAAVGADRAAEQARKPRLVSEVRPAPAAISAVQDHPGGTPAVTLTGAPAIALVEYEAAAKELKAANELHQRATERYQRAHQAFADAMAAR